MFSFSFSHIEKITTWQDPRKAMNQPLNHMNLRPAATSTPAPQRPMAVSQPNLGKSQLRLGMEPRDRRSTERLWVAGCRRPRAPTTCLLLLLLLGCILFPPPLPSLPGLSGFPGFTLPSQQPSLKNHVGLPSSPSTQGTY